MGSQQQRVQVVLFSCVFLFVFTEVLMSPFYPQFFAKVFGVVDLDFTAFYIFVCRLTVICFAPVWGWLARKVEVKHLLFVGQAGAAMSTAMMAMSQNIKQFVAFSVILLIFKSCYLLVYPLIVQLNDRGENAAVTGKYHAVFHSAVIVSTLLGGWAITIEQPLHIFWWIAAADVCQLLLCWIMLRPLHAGRQTNVDSEMKQGNVTSFVLTLGAVIFVFHLIYNLVRPYFTVYTGEVLHTSSFMSSLLFMIPSVMAIIAFPFVKKWCTPHRLGFFYMIGMGVIAGSLLLQGLTASVVAVAFGRILFGFFIAVCQAVLEIRLFAESSQSRLSFHYSIASAFQNTGLLVAPLAASFIVGQNGLAAPFIAAAVLCLLNVMLASLILFSPMKKNLFLPKVYKS